MAGPTRLWALGVAAFAVERAWAFDPIDSSTWANACVGHVQAVGAHARALLIEASARQEAEEPTAEAEAEAEAEASLLRELQLRVSALLTDGALCMSMALSAFDQAHEALEAAISIQEIALRPPTDTPASPRSPRSPRPRGISDPASTWRARLSHERALTLHTAGKVRDDTPARPARHRPTPRASRVHPSTHRAGGALPRRVRAGGGVPSLRSRDARGQRRRPRRRADTP